MKLHTAHSSEPRAAAERQQLTKNGDGAEAGVVENAAAVVLQRMANGSPQVQQVQQYAAMANKGGRSMPVILLPPGAGKQHSVPAQRKAVESPPVPRKHANGLPEKLQQGMEQLSGIPLDDVTVAYNSDQPAQLQAHAFARGTEIHVARGQEQHLPHEAWHVVQQKKGSVRPTLQLNGEAINDDPQLEQEADDMGMKALAWTPSPQPSISTNPPGIGSSPVQASVQRKTAVVQRDYRAPDWTSVTAAIKSGDGLVSGVYLITSVDNVVVKVGSNPGEVTGNARILGRLGIRTPGARGVEKGSEEGRQIHAALTRHLPADTLRVFEGQIAVHSHYIVMERVQGESFKRAGGAELLRHFRNDQVLISFGKQAIADALMDIGDRILSNQNPGNLMVSRGGEVFAVDNESNQHSVRPMREITDLVNWDGSAMPERFQRFALNAARNSGADNAEAIMRQFRSRQARNKVREGIQAGFREIVALARADGIGNRELTDEILELHVQRNKCCCYITTACMTFKGLPDDCYQLTVLRNYRDNYMLQLPEGQRLLEMYYHTAPSIVRRIDEEEWLIRRKRYRQINKVINQCVSMIENGKLGGAFDLYCRMVTSLIKRYH